MIACRGVEAIGHWQQQGDGHRGADAREHTDSGAQHDAEKAYRRFIGGQGDRESVDQVVEGTHHRSPSERRPAGRCPGRARTGTRSRTTVRARSGRITDEVPAAEGEGHPKKRTAARDRPADPLDEHDVGERTPPTASVPCASRFRSEIDVLATLRLAAAAAQDIHAPGGRRRRRAAPPTTIGTAFGARPARVCRCRLGSRAASTRTRTPRAQQEQGHP